MLAVRLINLQQIEKRELPNHSFRFSHDEQHYPNILTGSLTSPKKMVFQRDWDPASRYLWTLNSCSKILQKTTWATRDWLPEISFHPILWREPKDAILYNVVSSLSHRQTQMGFRGTNYFMLYDVRKESSNGVARPTATCQNVRRETKIHTQVVFALSGTHRRWAFP